MSIIVLCSASGSPGVSTTALGLALAWPRPTLLIEADPTGASAMLTGYLRQYAPNGIPSVFDLAVQHRQTGVIPPVREAALEVPETTIRLLSGIRNHTHAATVAGLWGPMTAQLQDLNSAGIDVIVDLGRLGLLGSPTSLINAADLNLLVTRSTLPALAPAKHWASELSAMVGGPASFRAGLLIVGAGHPYKADEIAKQLALPATTTLPLDPTTAEVFHLGHKPGRRFDRSPLYRSLPPAVAAIQKQIAASNRTLNAGGDQ